MYWLISGTNVYNKMKQILMNTRILNDIKNLSSEDQTSCLEGFHSTLNQFHPKMLCFSWLGPYCRQQGSKKNPSGRSGQVDFPFRQVTFSPSLPDGQGPRQAVRRLNF